MSTGPDDPFPDDLLVAPFDDDGSYEAVPYPSYLDPSYVDVAARKATAAPPKRTGRAAGRAPLGVAAAVAAGWAVLTSYGSVLALTVLAGVSSGAGLPGMARLATFGWLLSHGVPVRTPTDRITLVPLALTALVGWRLVRAGIQASRAVGGHRIRTPWTAVAAAGLVAVAYAAIGALVAWLVSTAELTVSPLRAALSLGLFAGVAGTIGAVGHSRAGRAAARRALARPGPALLVSAARTGACAAALILAAGAGIAGVALAVHGGEAASILASYRTGVAGEAGITVLCLAYVPNAAGWGAGYLLGPGFSVGLDTVVSPGAVLIGPLPGLPVLAGLPTVPLTGAGPALLGLPVVAGLAAGILLARSAHRRRVGAGRRSAPTGGWGELLITAALAGPVAGLLVQAFAVASAGGLGSGRLAELGPHGVSVGIFATLVVTAGAMVGAAATRSLRPADDASPAITPSPADRT